MAQGLLDSFGQGLQGAGAILSDRVYDTQAAERKEMLPNMMRALEIKKAQATLKADEDYAAAIKEAQSGMQPSSLTTASGMLDLHSKIPLDLIASSPKAQQTFQLIGRQQAREDAAAAAKAAAEAKKEAATARAMEHFDRMEQRKHEFEVRSEDKAASDKERAEARLRAIEAKEAMDKFHRWSISQGLEIRREAVGARKEAAAAKVDAATEKAIAPVQDLVADIDQAIKMVQQNPGVTGARGIFGRGKELISTTFSGDTNTPANDFQSQLLQIQSKWKKLPTVAAQKFKSDADKIDKAIKGLGLGTNDTITVNNLTQLRDSLARGIEAKGGEPPPEGDPAAPKPTAGPAEGAKDKSKSGKPMTFTGGQWVYD